MRLKHLLPISPDLNRALHRERQAQGPKLCTKENMMSPFPSALINMKTAEADIFIPRKMLTVKAASERVSHSHSLHHHTLKALSRSTASIAQASENRLPGSPWTLQREGIVFPA